MILYLYNILLWGAAHPRLYTRRVKTTRKNKVSWKIYRYVFR